MTFGMRNGRGPLDWDGARRRLDLAALATAEALNPSPERARAILDERARALARVPAGALDAGRRREIVAFDLGGEPLALESRFVRHVLRASACTPIPGGPPHLEGLINLRGDVLAVFDLARVLGIAGGGGGDQARVLVLGGDRDEFGIRADAVREVTTMDGGGLSEPPVAARGLFRGITPGGLLLLDGGALLGDGSFVVDQAEIAAFGPAQGGGS